MWVGWKSQVYSPGNSRFIASNTGKKESKAGPDSERTDAHLEGQACSIHFGDSIGSNLLPPFPQLAQNISVCVRNRLSVIKTSSTARFLPSGKLSSLCCS